VVPLEATALLPIIVLPLAAGMPVGAVTASYADPIIFLFLGGFLLAATLERWELHRRFALAAVRAVGTEAPRVLLAFMVTSAVASMWISNTATAVMMLPIALAIVPKAAGRDGGFATALMLGVAYGCSIGGVATLIGTPPNAILAGAAKDLAGVDITFSSWLPIGLTAAIPMLASGWILLTRMFRVAGPVPGLAAALRPEAERLGRLGRGEWFVLGIFGATGLAWIMRAPKTVGALQVPGLSSLFPGISDAAIALAAALLLFAVPLRGARFPRALDWESARAIPWGILLLFGGGLALAGAFERSGLTEVIGSLLASLRGTPLPVAIAATAALFVLLTELTSNTATAALGMPLVAGVAGGLGIPPLPLMAAAALSASMAFMLPVATPPNAIVFGSGHITAGAMARAGAGLNVVAVAIITMTVWLWTS
jgi:sodium-dependent dicarboxylate transporter 2/3/5